MTAARDLGYGALMMAVMLAAVGWMFLWLEAVPALVAMARLTARAARAVFLTVGWVIAVARLLP